MLGRTFSAYDGRPDAPPVFIMNYRLWKKEFSGDPSVLNSVSFSMGSRERSSESCHNDSTSLARASGYR